MHEISRLRKAQDDDKDESDFLTRLEDLIVEEVSIVDRGANRRPILVRKKGTESMPTGDELHNDEDGNLTKSDPFGIDGSDKKEKPSEEDAEEKKAKNPEKNTEEKSNNDKDKKNETSEKQAIPKAVKAKVIEMAEIAEKQLNAVVSAVKEAKESDASDRLMPAKIGSELCAVASVLRGVVSKYPSPSTKAETEDGEDEEKKKNITKADDGDGYDNAEKANRLLWRVMDRINQGAFDSEKTKSTVDSIVSTLKEELTSVAKADNDDDTCDGTMTNPRLGDAQGARDGSGIRGTRGAGQGRRTNEKQAIELPKAVKSALISSLSDIGSNLSSLIAKVKESQETDERSDNPLPDSLAKGFEGCVKAIDAIMEKYPASKAMAKSESQVKEAFKLLTGAVAKLQPGSAIDDVTFKAVDKARQLLGQLADPPKAEEADDDTKRETTAKAGAKQMSADRRKRFKDALDALAKLFDEMIPGEKQTSWPVRRQNARKADEVTDIEKQDEITKLREKIAKLETATAATVRESNVQKVDTAPGNGSAGKPFLWGSDLNESEETNW